MPSTPLIHQFLEFNLKAPTLYSVVFLSTHQAFLCTALPTGWTTNQLYHSNLAHQHAAFQQTMETKQRRANLFLTNQNHCRHPNRNTGPGQIIVVQAIGRQCQKIGRFHIQTKNGPQDSVARFTRNTFHNLRRGDR